MLRTIKARLTLLVAGLSLALGLVGLASYLSQERLDESVEVLASASLPSLASVAELKDSATRMMWRSQRMLHLASLDDEVEYSRVREQLEADTADFERARSRFGAQERLLEEVEPARQLGETYPTWRASIEELWKARASGASSADLVRIWRERCLPEFAAVNGATTALLRAAEEAGSRVATQADEARESAMSTVLTFVAVSLALAMAAGSWVIMSITRPLERIGRAAEAISNGDVDQLIDYTGRDEVGAVAESFRRSIDYLKDLAGAARSLARGELDYPLEPRSDADELARSFLESRQKLKGLIQETQTLIAAARDGDLATRGDTRPFEGAYRELVDGLNAMVQAVAQPTQESARVLDRLAAKDLTARMNIEAKGEFLRVKTALNTAADNLENSFGAVSQAAEQVAAAASEIASGSSAVAQGASQQAASLQDTSSSLATMSAKTQQNAGSARQANDLAAEAQASSADGVAMASMSDAMDRIRASAEGTAAIIRDINDITFQTNLLALNAAVEAARAGDAGRGFAVVAEEVRNLALRSKEAAKRTESLIRDSVTLAQQGQGISHEVGTALERIVSRVTQVSSIVAEIASASGEQAQGIERITRAVGEMDKVTQQNAANSEQSASAAEELSSQAQELTALAQQFQLSGTRAQPSSRVRKPSGPRSLVRPHSVLPRTTIESMRDF